MELSGREYVDVYAQKVKSQLTKTASKPAEPSEPAEPIAA
jgi:hypothetical protein